MEYISLDNAVKGTSYEIKRINVEGTMRRRLLDLGFHEKSRVICLGFSPFKDPVAFLVKGTVIAVRKENLAQIYAEEVIS